jgi:hypothetical protein
MKIARRWSRVRTCYVPGSITILPVTRDGQISACLQAIVTMNGVG